MHKKRLLKLADLLEADAKNKEGVKFDLSAWAKKEINGELNRWGFKRRETVKVNCNTAACAWGLAAISGAFKRQGVGYRINISGDLSPTFNRKTDFEAAEEFFDISSDHADFLFEPCRYPEEYRTEAKGERYVAKRIRDFVAGKVAP